jgi:hypothetical protein
MTGTLRNHSVVLLGSYGVARRAACVPGACALQLLGWPIPVFSYLHDRMALRNFWMTRVPLLRSWFLRARRLHDIDHRSVNSKGFMNTDFGIGFTFFGRFFRTMAKSHPWFHGEGYQAAIGRYGLEGMELLSLRGCSKALFPKETGIKTASPHP